MIHLLSHGRPAEWNGKHLTKPDVANNILLQFLVVLFALIALSAPAAQLKRDWKDRHLVLAT
jgi:hypothetical protein